MDCDRQNNGSTLSYHQNGEYIHGKETDFADVIKLKILQWRDSSDLVSSQESLQEEGRALCMSKLVYIFLAREWKGNAKKGEKNLQIRCLTKN